MVAPAAGSPKLDTAPSWRLMRMATVLTVSEAQQKTDRVGEIREGPPGSTLERGMHAEEASGTWEAPRVPPLKRS